MTKGTEVFPLTLSLPRFPPLFYFLPFHALFPLPHLFPQKILQNFSAPGPLSSLKSSELDEYTYRDLVVNAFRTFAQLNNVAVSGGVSIVPEDSCAETVTSLASDHFSDLVLIPWTDPVRTTEMDSTIDALSSGVQDAFIQKTLETASSNTAVFTNRGFGRSTPIESRALSRTVSGISLRSRREAPTPFVVDRSHHVYLTFFGGVEDHVARRFVLQLAQNSNITVTVIHFNTPIQSGHKGSDIITEPVCPSSSHLNISEIVDIETPYAEVGRVSPTLCSWGHI